MTGTREGVAHPRALTGTAVAVFALVLLALVPRAWADTIDVTPGPNAIGKALDSTTRSPPTRPIW